jgi:D-alanyl-D-alanine carboxypeptidase
MRPTRAARLLAAIAVAAGLPTSCTGSGTTPAPTTPAKLLSWIASHRSNVGLVVLPDGVSSPLVSLNASELFPLASTRKVLILGAYAEAVAAGRLSPSERVAMTALDRWWWPGTDGGAHPRAVADWRARDVLVNGSVPLDAVAAAMTRWSDNAAADYLLSRVGGPTAVALFARRAGMTSQQPVWPIIGEFIAWSTDAGAWLDSDAQGRLQLAGRAAGKPFRALSLPTGDEAFSLAETDSAGTPADWAGAMQAIATGRVLPPKVTALMQPILDWPRDASAANAERFAAYLTKGGSLPGVLTEASYIRMVGQPSGTSIALFFRDLPKDVFASMSTTFVHQQFMVQLAGDVDFLRRAEQVLR